MPEFAPISLSKSGIAALTLAAIAGTAGALALASSGATAGPQAFCNKQPADTSMASPGTYVGGPANEVIIGSSGDDRIHARAGTDTVCAGNGNDLLGGGKDDDQLFGENGADLLRGRADNDELDGGTSFGGTTVSAPTSTKVAQRGNPDQDECHGNKPFPDTQQAGDTATNCEFVKNAIDQDK